MIGLRKLTVEDYPAMREIYMNPRVGFPAAVGAIETEEKMRRLAAALILAENYAIELEGKVVGVVGYAQTRPWMGEELAAVIGYAMHEDFWGRGICTKAVQALSEQVLDEGYDAVYADCFTDNPASARVLEKSGFVYICDIRKEFPCFPEPRRLHLYRKSRIPLAE